MKNQTKSAQAFGSPWFLAVSLLTIWLGPLLPATAQLFGADSKANWTGGGGADKNWSTPANWQTGAGLYAPPLNPMTQATPGNASGDVDFGISGYAHVDTTWTFGALLFQNTLTTFSMDGADIHLYQVNDGGTTLTQSRCTIQLLQGADTAPHTVNITNNLFFDDEAYVASGNPNLAVAEIFGNNSSFGLNFYGNLTMTNPNMELLIRGQSPVDIYGNVFTPTNSPDPIGSPNYSLSIAKQSGGWPGV